MRGKGTIPEKVTEVLKDTAMTTPSAPCIIEDTAAIFHQKETTGKCLGSRQPELSPGKPKWKAFSIKQSLVFPRSLMCLTPALLHPILLLLEELM